MRCSWPQQEERGKHGVNDSDAIDHVAVPTELERPVWDMFASSTLQHPEDDRSDLERLCGQRRSSE